MSEKIFARVDNLGNILDYPVFDYVIYQRGHSEDMYVKVDTSDKPDYNEYKEVNEVVFYNHATNTVKVIYEVKDKGVAYFFSKLNVEEDQPAYTPTKDDLDFLKAAVVREVEEGLQRLAAERSYDNITSLTSYMNSSDPTFKAEAIYGDQIRSTAYRNLYIYLNKVESGQLQLANTWEQLVADAQLPAFTWDNFNA